MPYGMLSSVALGCLELCLIGWLICLLAGGLVVTLGVLLVEYGAFLPYVVPMEGI